MALDNQQLPQASLLGIPPELRCRIYHFALEAESYQGNYRLCLTGNAKGLSKKFQHALFTLPFVCKFINAEVSPVLPAISDIVFVFQDFTSEDMENWLDTMGEDRLSQLQMWEIVGWAKCVGEFCKVSYHLNRECNKECNGNPRNTAPVRAMQMQGFCHRELKIDLTVAQYHLTMRSTHLDIESNVKFPDIRDLRDCSEVVQFNENSGLTFINEADCFQTGLNTVQGAIRGLVRPSGELHITKAIFSNIFEMVMEDRRRGIIRRDIIG